MQKILFSFICIFSLIINSFLPVISVYAQEATSSAADTISPQPTIEPTPDVTATPTETPTVTPVADSSPSAVVSDITPTIAVETPPAPSSTDTPAQQNETPATVPTVTVGQPNAPPATPSITPVQTSQGHIDTTIIKSETLNSINLYLNPLATLTTDKPDYSPTDIAIISGSDFLPNTDYTLIITSSDIPTVYFTAQIKTDDKGSFVYSYQLDGNYRPNYQVEVKDLSGSTIATTSFTDSPGAIWTTDVSCGGVNINNYSAKADVYLNGGPTGGGGDGLPNGNYFVQITEPNGTLLGKTLTASAHVSGGHFVSCYQLTELLYSVSSGFTSKGYDTSGNSGHEYKVWVDQNNDFKHSIKTDNFKIDEVPQNQGHLIVNKVTDPLNDNNTQFSITISGSVTNPTRTITGGSSVDYLVDAGTYSVSEATKTGWAVTGNTCINIVIASGETKTCTITNSKLAQITVTKDAVPNSAQDFTFINNFGNGYADTFLLDDDSNHTLPNTRTFFVLPGTYSISENPVTGWKQYSATCSNQNNPSAVTVAAGGVVTCTFVNHKLGTITLVKNTVGGDGTFTFDMTGQSLSSSSALTTVSGTAQQTFTGIDPDNDYSINENVPEGWNLDSVVCINESRRVLDNEDFGMNNGGTVTCTFTNTKQQEEVKGKIIIYKYDQSEKALGGATFRVCRDQIEGQPVCFSITDNGEGDANENSGIIEIENLEWESYTITETQAPQGYQKSDEECNRNLNSEIISTSCSFMNRLQEEPVLNIQKFNNKSGIDQNPGDNVLYTIVVTALQNGLSDVHVTDLLPKGFTFRAGSWRVVSSDNGDITGSLSAPTYHSPGTWSLGNMAKDETLTLTYTADIDSGEQPGLYKDLAWAEGTPLGGGSNILALAQPTGFVDINFVGTNVNVIKNQDSTTGVNVEKIEEKKGEVLGASIALPATGAENYWMIIASAMLLLSLQSLSFGIYQRRKNV